MKLSIIVPTKNESKNLEELFLRFSKLKLNKNDFEIIIADSESNDITLEISKKLAKKYSLNIQPIQTGKTDLSRAVTLAIKKTRGENIVVLDGDLQHPPELIPKLLETLIEENAEIVIASRFVKNSKVDFSKKRLFVSKVYRFMAHLFVPKCKNITDPASGFFIFKKNILKNTKLRPMGFKILLEILAKANYHKAIEISFKFEDRKKGESKFNFKQTKIAFKHLLKLAKNSNEHKKFLKFCIVGLSGILVNEGFLWFLTEFAGIFYLLSSLISIELSIISNFILNDVWTFKKNRKGHFLARFFKFNFTRIVASIINLGLLWLLTTMGMNYLIANLIGVAIATLITYFTSIWWVWK